MIKLSILDIDVDKQFTQYQLNDIADEYDLASNLRSLLILFRILNEETFRPDIRDMLQGTYMALAEKARGEIIDSMQKWLNSHTSGQHLFNWDDYNSDREATWAWSLVENGEVDNYSGFRFDFKPAATKRLLHLAREHYGELTEEDLESFKASQDELTISYDSETWKEQLSEEFREFIARKYTNQAFKAWKSFWGTALEKPTKDVKQAINRLKTSQGKDLITAISLALNVYHVHGQMYEHANLTERDLDYLDNVPNVDIEKFKSRIFGDAYKELSYASEGLRLSNRDIKELK